MLKTQRQLRKFGSCLHITDLCSLPMPRRLGTVGSGCKCPPTWANVLVTQAQWPLELITGETRGDLEKTAEQWVTLRVER
jgi:hypothetical protein